LLNKTGTDVVISITELNFLSDGDTILSNFWSSKSLVDNNVSSSWTKSYLNSICKHVAALEHSSSGISAESDFLTELSSWKGFHEWTNGSAGSNKFTKHFI